MKFKLTLILLLAMTSICQGNNVKYFNLKRVGKRISGTISLTRIGTDAEGKSYNYETPEADFFVETDGTITPAFVSTWFLGKYREKDHGLAQEDLKALTKEFTQRVNEFKKNGALEMPEKDFFLTSATYKSEHTEYNHTQLGISDTINDKFYRDYTILYIGDALLTPEQIKHSLIQMKECRKKALEQRGYIDYLLGRRSGSVEANCLDDLKKSLKDNKIQGNKNEQNSKK